MPCQSLSDLWGQTLVTTVLWAWKTLVPTRWLFLLSLGAPLSPVAGSEAPSSLTLSLCFRGYISSVPHLPANTDVTSVKTTAAGTGARETPDANPAGR